MACVRVKNCLHSKRSYFSLRRWWEKDNKSRHFTPLKVLCHFNVQISTRLKVKLQKINGFVLCVSQRTWDVDGRGELRLYQLIIFHCRVFTQRNRHISYLSVHKFTIHSFDSSRLAPRSIMDWINWNLLIRFFAKCFMCINSARFPYTKLTFSSSISSSFFFFNAMKSAFKMTEEFTLWIIPSYKEIIICMRGVLGWLG